MPYDMEKRMADLEKALATHLAECGLQNKMMWSELRGVKFALWAAFSGSFTVLLMVVGLLLKNHLHL
jgi:hypothetical protein